MPVPKTLGKYEIRRELGRGGMGRVYEGWDTVLKRPVAIKTMYFPAEAADDQTAELRKRFRREAEAAAGLLHPNIAIIYDYGGGLIRAFSP